jgi:pimeloyl-ACP methyl ester carboxylesterase
MKSVWGAALWWVACAAQADCMALKNLKLPQARVDSAQWVAAGDKLALWSGGAPQAMPKGFCRVRGLATPVPGSAIGFEVWLPEATAWNGKYLQAGNGGTAGAVPLSSLLDGVVRGYASAATDSGHVWPDGLDYGWATQRPQSVVDFGWRAVQRTSDAALRIVRQGLGRAPAKSYFMGCSDGGRDAMMVAQRFPERFDGIVAGAPAIAWLDMMIGGALLQRELAPPTGVLPVAKLPALQAAARAACAAGSKFIADPQQCRFDPSVLLCTGAETDACLTERQLSAVRTAYAGLTDAAGRRIPGLAMGAEAEPGNWDFWLLRAPTNPIDGSARPPGAPPPTSINESFFRHLVREDPAFKLADLRDADIVQARQRWSSTLDALDPDLSKLKRRGTKMLHYHGWTDAPIPPRMSLDYFASVQQRMGDTRDFHRLFMVPGMNHCGGGEGPWQVDWLGVLERWVEQGEAPTELTARHPQNGGTQVLRPHGLR